MHEGHTPRKIDFTLSEITILDLLASYMSGHARLLDLRLTCRLKNIYFV